MSDITNLPAAIADALPFRPFDFEGGAFRVAMRGDEPRFVLADIARALEIGNPADAARRLDNDEKGIDSIATPGGLQEALTVNESGLYSLVMTSRKPAAKRFKRWVTSEVLPSIRRTGGYVIARPEDSEADIQARVQAAVREAVERRDADIIRLQSRVIAQIDEREALRLDVAELESDIERLAAESRAASARVIELSDATEAQAARLAETEPAAQAFEQLAGSRGALSLRDAAKALNARPLAFNDFLASTGWIYRSDGDWMPYSMHLDNGDLIVIALKPRNSPRAPAVTQVKVTPRGLAKLARMMPKGILNQAAAKAWAQKDAEAATRH